MKLLGFEITRPKERKPIQQKYQRSQMRASEFEYGASIFGGYQSANEIKTFKMMRNLISFLDAAVLKRTLLLGDFEIYGEDDTTTEFLQNYKKTIRENYFGRGWINFLHQHADSTYTTGIGLSERINRDDMSGALHLMNGDPEYLRFIKDQEQGYVLGFQTPGMGQPKAYERPEMIYYTAFDKRYGSPKGYSLFHGLEFATQLQTRLMQALHNQVWRIGDPIYVAITKGETVESEYDGVGPEAVSNNFSTQLKSIFQARSQGQVGDAHLYMPGDYEFEVKALGVDGIPLFDFNINSRLVLEQLITKTHLPPYAFGFYQWNSNYKMSTDQQKLLIQAVESDRDKLESIIDRDFGMELFLAGKRKKFWFEWMPIDLTDLMDNANAGKANAEALKANVDTQVSLLWMNGLIDDNTLMNNLEMIGAIDKNANKQKIIESLGNVRKLALLNQITKETAKRETNAILH